MDATTLGATLFLAASGLWCWRSGRRRPFLGGEPEGPRCGDARALGEAVASFVAELRATAESSLEEVRRQREELLGLIAAADERVAALAGSQGQGLESAAGREEAGGVVAETDFAAIIAEEKGDEAAAARRLGVGRGELRLGLALRGSGSGGEREQGQAAEAALPS
jgi:hypothetical protein